MLINQLLEADAARSQVPVATSYRETLSLYGLTSAAHPSIAARLTPV